jgi:hypothetical protein
LIDIRPGFSPEKSPDRYKEFMMSHQKSFKTMFDEYGLITSFVCTASQEECYGTRAHYEIMFGDSLKRVNCLIQSHQIESFYLTNQVDWWYIYSQP